MREWQEEKRVYFGYILLSTKRIIERNISEKE